MTKNKIMVIFGNLNDLIFSLVGGNTVFRVDTKTYGKLTVSDKSCFNFVDIYVR